MGASGEEGGDGNELDGLTRSPAMTQRASRSIASLRLKILSSMRASATSSSLCLRKGGESKSEGVREDVGVSEAYRPGSYVDAIGESSQCMLIVPSNGRGSARTIFASTCVSTPQIRIRNKWGASSRQ